MALGYAKVKVYSNQKEYGGKEYTCVSIPSIYQQYFPKGTVVRIAYGAGSLYIAASGLRGWDENQSSWDE